MEEQTQEGIQEDEYVDLVLSEPKNAFIPEFNSENFFNDAELYPSFDIGL